MMKCDADGPTVVHVTKLFATSDAQEFRAFGRVMSGSVKRGQAVKVLGEGYSLEDEEDMVSAIVEGILIDESRCVLSLCLRISVLTGRQLYCRYRPGSCWEPCPVIRRGRVHLQNRNDSRQR